MLYNLYYEWDVIYIMKKNIIFIILLYFMSLITVIKVLADSPTEETPYQIEFESGNKIFYMYPCYMSDENGELDKSWLKSGLYYNTEPHENIYLINSEYTSVKYYFYESELVFSDDGIYFATMPWSYRGDPGKPDGSAIEFYKNGKFVNKYVVADLVENNSKLEYSVSHVTWEKRENRHFDAENNILSVTTKDDIVYKFDLVTGNIIDKAIDRVNIGHVQNP